MREQIASFNVRFQEPCIFPYPFPFLRFFIYHMDDESKVESRTKYIINASNKPLRNLPLSSIIFHEDSW